MSTLLLCWVNMCWNVPTENRAEMLSQTNMSGLGVLLIVNKACVHSRACVVQSMFRKKRRRKKTTFQNISTVLDRDIWWRHTSALQYIKYGAVSICYLLCESNGFWFSHIQKVSITENVSCWICSNVTGWQQIEMQSTHDIKHLARKTTSACSV